MPDLTKAVPEAEWWMAHSNVVELIQHVSETHSPDSETIDLIIDIVSTPWSYEDEWKEYKEQAEKE